MIAAVTLTQPELAAADVDTGVAVGSGFRWGRYVAALALALLAAGAVFWLASYQPLTADLGGGYAGGVLTNDGYESIALDNVYGSERRIVAPGPGDEIGLLFALHNSGHLGVTVVSVGQPFNPTGTVGTGMHVDETSAGHASRATDPSEQHWVDVTPFALAPGDYTQIRVTFSILDCATELTTPGAASIATTVPVTYRTLGLTRTADVPLPFAVSIESLPHCPYATG